MGEPSISTKNVIEFSNVSVGILIKALTRKKKTIRLKARGISMFPAIRNKDIITIAPLNDYEPETGDIVVCIDKSNQNVVIHRIIKKFENTVKTKGDFCFLSDGIYPLESVTGYILKIENDLKFSYFSINIRYKKLFAFLSRVNVLTFAVRFLKKIYL